MITNTSCTLDNKTNSDSCLTNHNDFLTHLDFRPEFHSYKKSTTMPKSWFLYQMKKFKIPLWNYNSITIITVACGKFYEVDSLAVATRISHNYQVLLEWWDIRIINSCQRATIMGRYAFLSFRNPAHFDRRIISVGKVVPEIPLTPPPQSNFLADLHWSQGWPKIQENPRNSADPGKSFTPGSIFRSWIFDIQKYNLGHKNDAKNIKTYFWECSWYFSLGATLKALGVDH